MNIQGINKNSILAGAVILFALVSSLVWIVVRQTSTDKDKTTNLQQKLEVATDPSFPEVGGALIEGVPSLPVYPEATLVASAKTNPPDQPDSGYRIKWRTTGSVAEIMTWYQKEMPKNGWTIEPSNDPDNTGEQVTQISKGDFSGYIGVESEEQQVEIVVEVLITK